MKLFGRKRVQALFQTRHAESAIRVNSQAVMNVAHDVDRNVCMIWFHQHHLELYPGDTITVLKDLIQQMGLAIENLEETIAETEHK